MVELITFLMVLPLTVLSQDDPCKNYRMLFDDGGRSIKCSLYHPDSHDRFIDEGWRRIQLESTGEDLTMPTQCVPRGYCGSHSNVWLNGTHPTVEDGIVDRVGCLSMFSSCCKVLYPIQIKNCTDYMVYNLTRTWGSGERYCFGDSNHCYLTSRPSTVLPTTKTPRLTTKTPRRTTSYLTTKTPRLTTKTPRRTTPYLTTKTPRRTTPYLTTKTPRLTTKTPRRTTPYLTTKTPRPTTKNRQNYVDNNHPGSQKTTNDHEKLDLVSDVQEYKSDEIVTILGVCLSITIAILVTLAVGIFCYFRQRQTGTEYEVDTKPTKA